MRFRTGIYETGRAGICETGAAAWLYRRSGGLSRRAERARAGPRCVAKSPHLAFARSPDLGISPRRRLFFKQCEERHAALQRKSFPTGHFDVTGVELG